MTESPQLQVSSQQFLRLYQTEYVQSGILENDMKIQLRLEKIDLLLETAAGGSGKH